MPGAQQSFYRFYDAGALEWIVDVHMQETLLIQHWQVHSMQVNDRGEPAVNYKWTGESEK